MLRLARGPRRRDHRDFSGDECACRARPPTKLRRGNCFELFRTLRDEGIDAPGSVSFASHPPKTLRRRRTSSKPAIPTRRISLFRRSRTRRILSAHFRFATGRARTRNHRNDILGRTEKRISTQRAQRKPRKQEENRDRHLEVSCQERSLSPLFSVFSVLNP